MNIVNSSGGVIVSSILFSPPQNRQIKINKKERRRDEMHFKSFKEDLLLHSHAMQGWLYILRVCSISLSTKMLAATHLFVGDRLSIFSNRFTSIFLSFFSCHPYMPQLVKGILKDSFDQFEWIE